MVGSMVVELGCRLEVERAAGVESPIGICEAEVVGTTLGVGVEVNMPLDVAIKEI